MKFLTLLALCGGLALGQNSTDYADPANYPNPFAVCGDTSGKAAFERNYRGDEPILIGLTPPDRNRPGERLSPVIDGLLEDSVWSFSDTLGVGNMTKMYSVLQGGSNLCVPVTEGVYRYTGVNDLFAVWRYMYNKDGLYIGIQIHDDILDTLTKGRYYNNDAFELKIDPSDWGLYEAGKWSKDYIIDYSPLNTYTRTTDSLKKVIDSLNKAAAELVDTSSSWVITYSDTVLYYALRKHSTTAMIDYQHTLRTMEVLRLSIQQQSTFRRYVANDRTFNRFPDQAEWFFMHLGKEINRNNMGTLLNESIIPEYDYVDGAVMNRGIKVASKYHGKDQWGRSVIHVEIMIPFHSDGSVWSNLNAMNYFDANGFPREGQLFKMSFTNIDNDSSKGNTTTNKLTTYLTTEQSDIFHEYNYMPHWSDTKYFPTFMFSRSVISGVRPIIGTISSTESEFTNESNSEFTINVIPNPFNPATKISVGNSKTPVAISIYDITGKCVAEFNASANSSVTWDAKGFSSGFYLVKAKSANKTISKRILLNK
ncbi:MAG: T9SS type A sorting domain-containing protein [Fibrobacteres bacterium]|nr:T9SS type A sorting domain-containing protein [Fibrobacterota bacterium]